MQLIEQIQQLDFPAPLPEKVLVVEQRFDAPKVDDVRAATRKALEESGILSRMQSGQTVAIGAGSRGIANLPVIVRAAVERLQEAGVSEVVLKPVVARELGEVIARALKQRAEDAERAT